MGMLDNNKNYSAEESVSKFHHSSKTFLNIKQCHNVIKITKGVSFKGTFYSLISITPLILSIEFAILYLVTASGKIRDQQNQPNK